MKRAAEFRAIARDALRGRWPIAVVTGFVASLMGAGIVSDGGSGSSGDSYSDIVRQVQSTQAWQQMRGIVVVGLGLLVVWLIVTLIIGGAGKLGYASFNLKLVDKRDVSLGDLFSQFHRLGDGFCMNFLTGLYTLLWSLLFLIPGIIKTFSYAMTPYVLAEHPGMTANEAITRSRQIMDGNKWRLFCLSFSFIGWSLLCAAPAILTLGVVSGMAVSTGNLAVFLLMLPASIPTFVGALFLRPYQEAAYAAFYREISGTDSGYSVSF